MASDFFFTLVSLVVAISGAVFTIIITVQQLLRDSVEGSRRSGREIFFAADKYADPEIKAMAKEGFWIFRVGYALWLSALVVPIVVFGIYAFHCANRVLNSEVFNQPEIAQAPAGKQPQPDPKIKAKADAWFTECKVCQMKWLWWVRTFGIVALLGAGISIPLLLLGSRQTERAKRLAQSAGNPPPGEQAPEIH